MEALKLEAQSREITGKKVKTVRLTGRVPAVLYGHGTENKNVTVDARGFDKLFAKAGESSLIDLSVDGGAPVKVLVQETQVHPLRNNITHVDFRQVNMNEKLEADIALKFVGESPAVKGLGAILVKNMDSITVKCLPGDLVHEIEVNLGVLAKFDDRITVADLPLPAGAEFMAKANQVVAIVSAPMSEEELAASLENKEVDVTAIKAVNEEKKAERAAAKEAGDEAAE